MKNKIKIKLVIAIIAFIISYSIFSNWDDFKAGLMGKPSIQNLKIDSK